MSHTSTDFFDILAEESGQSRQTVTDAARELEAHGYVKLIRNGDTVVAYHLRIPDTGELGEYTRIPPTVHPALEADDA